MGQAIGLRYLFGRKGFGNGNIQFKRKKSISKNPICIECGIKFLLLGQESVTLVP